MRHTRFPFWLMGLAWFIGASAQARQDIELDLITDNGRVLAQYPTGSSFGDTWRAYVEAERGLRYSIRARNQLDTRIGLVIAVDGRNIISGQASRLSNQERMYILQPGEQAVYGGWRTAQDTVNRFYFSDKKDSYAYAWNDTAELGVIAVAVYQEEIGRDHKYSEGQRGPAPQEKSGPGTGFGEEAYSPSHQVEFTPKSQASRRYYLRYEWRDSLCRKEVLRCEEWDEPYRRAPHHYFAPPPPLHAPPLFQPPPPLYAPPLFQPPPVPNDRVDPGTDEPLRHWRR